MPAVDFNYCFLEANVDWQPSEAEVSFERKRPNTSNRLQAKGNSEKS